ncbi:MAG: AAA family ATPase [Candidatus Bathyarchaeia archaeon]
MKIAVSGKGGVGKTFVAGALAKFFADKGFKVLAIDADPSPNLALTLGIPAERAEKIVPISENQKLIESKTGMGFTGVYRLSFTVDDIVKDFSVPSPFGVNLLVMGTVRSAGAGCMCPANAVIRALLQHLLVEREEAVVLDLEAGVEHMGRGTAKHVDTLLIITDASLKSLETAKKIYELAVEAEIKKIFAVANKIAKNVEEETIRKFMKENKIPFLGVIPYDEQVLEADRRGETPLAYTEGSKALLAIGKLGEQLLSYGSA